MECEKERRGKGRRGHVGEAEGEGDSLELSAGGLVDLEPLLEGEGAFRDDLERGLEGVDQVLSGTVQRSGSPSRAKREGGVKRRTTGGVAK